MNVFKSIDWNPSLNDIIDNEFIDGDRLERESVTYRLLRGSFTDPFADVHEDFKDLVTKEDLDALEQKKASKKIPLENKKKIENESTDGEKPAKSEGKFAKYYPGILRAKAKFPRWSSLSVEQHATCLRVLLQFSAPGKPDLSKIKRDELAIYSSLQPTISEEQSEFLKLAKDQWNPEEVQLVREDLLDRKWKYKMKYLETLPRYYTENGNIPFVSDKNINVRFDETVFETGKIPRVMIPPLTRPTYVLTESARMERSYFTFPEEFVDNTLVSKDENCLKFAESKGVDLVISSSGLNCLANNLDPSYRNSWCLPVTVREINGKLVGFIDKPLPPQSKNVIQKNSWIFKDMLKSVILHPRHFTSVTLDKDQKKFVDLDSPEEEREFENSKEEDFASQGRNSTYNVFTIGACGLPQNELMKNKVEREYKILVRTKIDGVERWQNKQFQCMTVTPKLEHQLSLGAEAVTLEEASKQWAALTFRPDTTLLRVRIHWRNAEIIQYERRTAMSVNNEMKRLYNVKGEDSLHVMYNIAEAVSKMLPGRYLIRHTPRTGAFASVYSETETPGTKTIDLQAIYGDDVFHTIPNPPWPQLDKVVSLPMHDCFNRFPALFHPNKKASNSGTGNKSKAVDTKISQRKCPRQRTRAKKKAAQKGKDNSR